MTNVPTNNSADAPKGRDGNNKFDITLINPAVNTGWDCIGLYEKNFKAILDTQSPIVEKMMLETHVLSTLRDFCNRDNELIAQNLFKIINGTHIFIHDDFDDVFDNCEIDYLCENWWRSECENKFEDIIEQMSQQLGKVKVKIFNSGSVLYQ